MTRHIAAGLSIAGLMLILGCGGGREGIAPDAIVDDLIGAGRTVGALPASNDESTRKHHRGDRLMGLIHKAQDGEVEGVTLDGTLEGGGTATLDNVVTPKGTLSGTFSWSGKPAEDATTVSHHTTKHLTFIPNAEAGERGIPELGAARQFLTDIEVPLLPDTFDAVQIDSDITMNGTKGDRESFSRTGTTTIVFQSSGEIMKTITLIWDAPRTLTVEVDGQRQVIDLSQIKAKMNTKEGPVVLPTRA